MAAYDEQDWVNGSAGGTPVSAARLSHMEAGIASAQDTADDAEVAASAAQATADGLTAADVGALALTGGTVTGDVTVTGNETIQSGAGKAYRFRTNGSNLDLEGTGSDIFLSVWSGAAFNGTQQNYMRLESGAALLHLIGQVIFAASTFGAAVHTLDPATGVASLGGKNGLAAVKFCGFKATSGAPTTGTWAAGDVVLDSAGVWHLCSVSGTPGTWT